MDFDSPDVAKEFPGLYMGELVGKTLTDPAVYEEDEKAKKKKDKKDSKKDKGYATLAGESSHEEDDLDPKSPGKTKKIKASFKLSAKKKDKKSLDKPDKDKERRNSSSDKKPVEKEKEDKKKVEKEKEKKVDKKKKSLTGELVVGTISPNTPIEKEKGLNSINIFKNAPAPLMKKDKDVKKDKESSTSSKVKLKLKRSKNSLESDSQSSQFDIPVTVSHQFPEEPEAIVKEIKKYETLLEQTHSHMKSSKKVSKKSEEQLWELQRTLTQLKRKLRSINALSVGSGPSTAVTTTVPSTAVVNNSIPAALLPKPPDLQQQNPPCQTKILSTNSKDEEERPKEIIKSTIIQNSVEIPVAVVSSVVKPVEASHDEDMKIDFTLMTANPSIVPAAVVVDSSISTQIVSREDESLANENVIVNAGEMESFSPPLPHALRDVETEPPSKSQRRLSNLNAITPESEIERVQVEVQVHTQKQSPSVLDTTDSICVQDDAVTTPDLQMDSAQLASIIKTLTFSDEEDDDNEEVTDVSCLSLGIRNYAENGIISSGDDISDVGFPRTVKNDNGSAMDSDPLEMCIFETEDYLPIENEALLYFNEVLQEEISKEEQEIENLMEELVEMRNSGVDIDAPEIELDLDQFDSDELVSLWQISKLENDALHEHVKNLRNLVAVAKLDEYRLDLRLKYLEDIQRSCVNKVGVAKSINPEENGA